MHSPAPSWPSCPACCRHLHHHTGSSELPRSPPVDGTARDPGRRALLSHERPECRPLSWSNGCKLWNYADYLYNGITRGAGDSPPAMFSGLGEEVRFFACAGWPTDSRLDEGHCLKRCLQPTHSFSGNNDVQPTDVYMLSTRCLYNLSHGRPLIQWKISSKVAQIHRGTLPCGVGLEFRRPNKATWGFSLKQMCQCQPEAWLDSSPSLIAPIGHYRTTTVWHSLLVFELPPFFRGPAGIQAATVASPFPPRRPGRRASGAGRGAAEGVLPGPAVAARRWTNRRTLTGRTEVGVGGGSWGPGSLLRMGWGWWLDGGGKS